MKNVQRLYPAIKPQTYRLTIEPDLDNFTYEISEEIDFELTIPSRELVFHAIDFEIKKVSLEGGPEVTKTNFDAESHTVRFTLAEETAVGTYTLKLELSGQISEGLQGFYRSYYEIEGERRYLATTQFEPVHARQVFVCIDEPSAKAVFEVAISAAPGLAALSNTAETRQEQRGASIVHHFEPTPKMSTYLLAFIVGELDMVETTSNNNIRVRVYTTPGKREQAHFALDVAARTLDFYDDYFAIPYPLSKLDMVAIPDFISGAMENWGLVTYREVAILVDEKHTALANKEQVATVVTHELAHQWFGNLVTMEWWTDLWLNEGFASWVEFLAIDHLFPEWQIWIKWLATEYVEARDADSLDNTHPVEIEVHDPAEIDEIFDVISYRKGASVIRMLHDFLGDTDFQAGLQHYLKRHSYANATTADLWQALEEASGKPVVEMMSAWTKQTGYPFVWLAGSTVRQSRFFLNPKSAGKSNDVWPIPVGYVTDQASGQFLLREATGELPAAIRGSKWFKLNRGLSGFFGVAYDDAQWQSLEAPLRQKLLDPADRLGIAYDAVHLNQAAELDTRRFLELLTSYRDEDNYAVWLSVLGGLGHLLGLVPDEYLPRLEEFGRWLIKPMVQKLGWDQKPGESHFDSLLRPQILGVAGRCGEPAVIKEAKKRFADHLAGKHLPPNLRLAVYSICARNGNKTTYEQLLQLFRTTELQEEKRRLLASLGSFQTTSELQHTLKLSLSHEVRPQDTLSGIVRVVMNRKGRQLAWEFIKSNWPELVRRYGRSYVLTHIPDAVGNSFTTSEMLAEIREFFAQNSVPVIKRSVRQALEQIETAVNWNERELTHLETFLEKFKAR